MKKLRLRYGKTTFLMVTHQVIASTRHLCCKPGPSDSRLQVLTCRAILSLHYTMQGHEGTMKNNEHHPCPREHVVLTYLSFSFLFAGWDKLMAQCGFVTRPFINPRQLNAGFNETSTCNCQCNFWTSPLLGKGIVILESSLNLSSCTGIFGKGII